VASSSYENWIEESTHRQESLDNSAAREAAKSGVAEEGVQELQEFRSCRMAMASPLFISTNELMN
jgi:mevalonate pyrophosphate decarboxylase